MRCRWGVVFWGSTGPGWCWLVAGGWSLTGIVDLRLSMAPFRGHVRVWCPCSRLQMLLGFLKLQPWTSIVAFCRILLVKTNCRYSPDVTARTTQVLDHREVRFVKAAKCHAKCPRQQKNFSRKPPSYLFHPLPVFLNSLPITSSLPL